MIIYYNTFIHIIHIIHIIINSLYAQLVNNNVIASHLAPWLRNRRKLAVNNITIFYFSIYYYDIIKSTIQNIQILVLFSILRTTYYTITYYVPL